MIFAAGRECRRYASSRRLFTTRPLPLRETQIAISRSRITDLRLLNFSICVAALLLTACVAPVTPRLTFVAPALDADSSVGAPTLLKGESSRGREVIIGRDGNCLLCHAIAETGARFMGNLGPPLSGIGARMNEAQLRLRLVDPQRFNPESIMPAYARTEGLEQVGKAWRGKPILNAQQVEDAVAYLVTLR